MVRYRLMHSIWAEYGPPVYISAAMYLGLSKPKAPVDLIENFDDLVNHLGALEGGTFAPSPFPSLEAAPCPASPTP